MFWFHKLIIWKTYFFFAQTLIINLYHPSRSLRTSLPKTSTLRHSFYFFHNSQTSMNPYRSFHMHSRDRNFSILASMLLRILEYIPYGIGNSVYDHCSPPCSKLGMTSLMRSRWIPQELMWLRRHEIRLLCIFTFQSWNHFAQPHESSPVLALVVFSNQTSRLPSIRSVWTSFILFHQMHRQ